MKQKKKCSISEAFKRFGHPIKRTKVPLSFFNDLSEEQCNLLALTTYPLAKRRTVYIFIVSFIVITSLTCTILALAGILPDLIVGIGLGVFLCSLILALASFPFAGNVLDGFKMIDGANRLRFAGFVRFLYGFARVLTYIFAFLIIFIMLIAGASAAGDDKTVVIGLPQDCEVDDVREIYKIFF